MKDFLRFMFLGELPPVFKIRRTKVHFTEKDEGPSEKPPDDRKEKYTLIKFITIVLSVVLFACLAAAFYQMYKDKPVPDFIILAIGGVIGYFGGALSVYFGFQPPK